MKTSMTAFRKVLQRVLVNPKEDREMMMAADVDSLEYYMGKVRELHTDAQICLNKGDMTNFSGYVIRMIRFSILAILSVEGV